MNSAWAQGSAPKNLVRLDRWQSFLAGRGSCVAIGATGHLLLDEAEIEEVRTVLRSRILPDLLARATGSSIMLVTGSAPGADLTIVETARLWFHRMGIRCEVVALEAVPIEYLLQDWIERLESLGQIVSANERAACAARLRQGFDDADLRVRLYADEDVQQADQRRWRQQQYRRLGARLALQMDVLVAVLRKDTLGEPGGTAEIVNWRKRPERIPASLRLLGAEEAPNLQRALLIIDPAPIGGAAAEATVTPAQQEAQLLEQAEEARSAGNDLLSLDLLNRALSLGGSSPHLHYLRIQALASVGSPEQALAQYQDLELDREALDEDWLALLGRIEKDLAQNDPQRAHNHRMRAATAYLDAFRAFGGHYSGVNAATMLCLAGDHAGARHLATETRKMLPEQAPSGAVERFYHHATVAEIALLLDRVDECQAALKAANDALPDDYNRRSRTRLQLRDLCLKLDIDVGLLDALPLPPVVSLTCAIEEQLAPGSTQLDALLAAQIPSGALLFMCIQGPAELAIAEWALRRQVRLYLCLPQERTALRKDWDRLYGEDVTGRLDTVVLKADRLSVLGGFLRQEHGWLCTELSQTSDGLSIMTALRRGSRWRSLRIEGAAEEPAIHIGETVDCLVTRDFPAPLSLGAGAPDGRRMVGILFADFAGYGRIPDVDLPQFWALIFGSVARILDQHRATVLLQQTWGDAIHVVTTDARSTASIAARIQSLVEGFRTDGPEALQELELRLALHYAPAYTGVDPIRRQSLYFGTQLAFAARIEPVAPPGMIYASEAFAARLMLDAPSEYAVDYAGDIELAKRFGHSRLFSLRALNPQA